MNNPEEWFTCPTFNVYGGVKAEGRLRNAKVECTVHVLPSLSNIVMLIVISKAISCATRECSTRIDVKKCLAKSSVVVLYPRIRDTLFPYIFERRRRRRPPPLRRKIAEYEACPAHLAPYGRGQGDLLGTDRKLWRSRHRQLENLEASQQHGAERNETGKA